MPLSHELILEPHVSSNQPVLRLASSLWMLSSRCTPRSSSIRARRLAPPRARTRLASPSTTATIPTCSSKNQRGQEDSYAGLQSVFLRSHFELASLFDATDLASPSSNTPSELLRRRCSGWIDSRPRRGRRRSVSLRRTGAREARGRRRSSLSSPTRTRVQHRCSRVRRLFTFSFSFPFSVLF